MSQHHDPVHPDSEHLSAEVLADLALDLLDAESTAHAQHHLSHCAACRRLRDDLTTVTTALADLPAVAMPDDVWSRLSASLEAEPVVTPAGAATVVPLDQRRRSRRPGMGVVAGAAGIALLGAIVVPMVFSTSAQDTSGGDGSITADGGARAESDQVPAVAYVASTTGTDYEVEELERQVTTLVARRSAFTATATLPPEPSTSPSPAETAAPTDVATSPMASGSIPADVLRVDGPQAAQACLESYLGVTGIAPLAIDIGTWDGERAAVIVLPAEDDPSLAEVWVLDPDCSGPGDPLFYFATVSR